LEVRVVGARPGGPAARETMDRVREAVKLKY
jgi:hypothetical protein